MDASHRCRPRVFFAAAEPAQCMSVLILTSCDCFSGFCLGFHSLLQSTIHISQERDKVLMKWTVASAVDIFFFQGGKKKTFLEKSLLSVWDLQFLLFISINSTALAWRWKNRTGSLFILVLCVRREALISASMCKALGSDNGFGCYTCWTAHVEFTDAQRIPHAFYQWGGAAGLKRHTASRLAAGDDASRLFRYWILGC